MSKRRLTATLILSLPLVVVACSSDEGSGSTGKKKNAPDDVATKAIEASEDGECGLAGGTAIELRSSSGEILATIAVCNGAEGSSGDEGAKGEPGDDGEHGDKGDAGEHGVAGSTLVTTSVTPAVGGSCGLAGGVRFDVVAADSSLVDSQVLCNGAAGVDGSSLLTRPSTTCGARGGVQIDVVDALGIVTATTDVCNGLPGVPGAWTCDTKFFGDGLCDTACGAADPDCHGPSDPYVPPLGQAQVAFLATEPLPEQADAVQQIFSFPSAVWFEDGTPGEVEAAVAATMQAAGERNELPTLVAYYLPYRDCAQYSAGGATSPAQYKAWIDGFARGLGTNQLGTRQAIVILEPDGLGIIPHNTTIYGSEEWCQPHVDGEIAPHATAEVRYELLNYAVDRLSAAGAAVYLDATHARWLGVGEAAYRLHAAGVQRARGFFVNVSNYQLTSESIQFATWVSSCITAATAGAPWAAGHFDWCPSQYNEALDFAVDYSPEYVETVDAGLAGMMDGSPATTPFVIDTSRNGNGPLDASIYSAAPYDQPDGVISALNGGNWCNPPGAGIGLRPTLDTGVSLLDAYLWIKIPGESDGQCDIAGGARAWDYDAYTSGEWTIEDPERFDPLWGQVDPPAGQWFPEQAAELISLANPAL